MKIVFMGTPEFSVGILNALVAAGHDVVAVYTQPPRPAGRGKAPRPSPVQVRAEALGLLVRSPVNFRDPQDREALAALNADIAVVVAYGLLLPQAVLDAPRSGCLNIHASLLPRWRGAAPIQRAILAGDAQTGVCIMQMEAGLDTGPVRLRRAIDIRDDETAATLHDRLAETGAQAIVDVLSDLPSYPPHPQAEDGATYAKKIDKAEARVDWSQAAEVVDRKIRGLSPFPGAWSEFEGTRIKFVQSELRIGAGAPGEVIDDDLTVATGAGAVGITHLQRAGKKAAPWDDVKRGFPMPKGARFV